MDDAIIVEVLVGVGLLGVLLVAAEVGFRAGRHGARSGAMTAPGQVGAIQGALLGLLGLLLGFSFAAAAARFLERQDLITTEANAIGTAYLRADLVPEPQRTELRSSLRDYTRRRLEISAELQRGLTAAHLTDIDRLHARIWKATMAGVEARPAALLALVEPVNEVIDLHSTRLAAGRKHLPMLVLGLLLGCSILAMGVIGYGGGPSGSRRLLLTGALAAVIALSLWITFDLDHPRAGLMQLSDAPLKAIPFDPPPP